MSQIERKPGAHSAGYSSSVGVRGDGEWVHVSGTIPAGSTVTEQTRSCFEQIAAALGEHGATLANVVRITTYLTSLDEYDEFSAVRAELFGAEVPASTAVQVAGLLFGGLVEIDAVAFVPA
jgi:enamine deaminase RidA (YjgF/YER057c/UK114 family)